MSISFQAIGTIYTPYFSLNTPHQPLPDAPGDFWITLNPDYTSALEALQTFNYIYILYYLDQATPAQDMLTRSPWAPELEIGLFASRSPQRPNPIGLSIVKLKEIRGNDLVISGIDAYNGTPLLDIKPYMHFLDSKEDANNGWFDALPNKEHTIAHALGLSHEHDHDHDHDHGHGHGLGQKSQPDHTAHQRTFSVRSHQAPQHAHAHNSEIKHPFHPEAND